MKNSVLPTSSKSQKLPQKNKIFCALIRFYQTAISPYFSARCRFQPTCSSYALECFQSFFWPKAFWLSFKRLLRCHPFCKGGHDPVPK